MFAFVDRLLFAGRNRLVIDGKRRFTSADHRTRLMTIDSRNGAGPDGTVFVIDGHAIYRLGVVAVVEAMGDAIAVGQAETVEEALQDPLLASANVIVADHGVPALAGLIAKVRQAGDVQVIVYSERCGQDDVLSSLNAGATGYLTKEGLTPEGLRAALRAALNGASVVPPSLLEAMVDVWSHAYARGVPARTGRVGSPLTEREQRVLGLFAGGGSTREVADQLSYSERTVKNVLHDAVTKLGAKSRSQAVADAVRQGLI